MVPAGHGIHSDCSMKRQPPSPLVLSDDDDGDDDGSSCQLECLVCYLNLHRGYFFFM